jgi:hypothetical protein
MGRYRFEHRRGIAIGSAFIAALAMGSACTKPPEFPNIASATFAQRDSCMARYAQARAAADSLRIDAHVPLPAASVPNGTVIGSSCARVRVEEAETARWWRDHDHVVHRPSIVIVSTAHVPRPGTDRAPPTPAEEAELALMRQRLRPIADKYGLDLFESAQDRFLVTRNGRRYPAGSPGVTLMKPHGVPVSLPPTATDAELGEQVRFYFSVVEPAEPRTT